MKAMIGALLLGGLLTGCVLLSPSQPQGEGNTSVNPQPQQREATPPGSPAAQAGTPGGAPAPPAPGQQPPQQRTFTLGAAATSLVNAAHAYGMGRKAVYLASGDPRAQASAWELVAASLRAQGRNDEAYVAEEKAVSL